MLSVQELHKSFDGVEVLRGVSAEIDKGDVVCIIGPSGSGKSTFLRCLNRMEQPDSGKIFLDGVELTAKKVDLDRQRQKMGMVFQQFNLFPNMTVLRNLTLAPTLLSTLICSGSLLIEMLMPDSTIFAEIGGVVSALNSSDE